jgi:hypothetical protein
MDLVNKCVVDTCSSVDAAIALTRITEDCGFVVSRRVFRPSWQGLIVLMATIM